MKSVTIDRHNRLDYVLGAAFLLAPYVFGFNEVYFAKDVFTVLGIAIIGYSLLTDYRHSLIKAVPLSMHMSFDIAVGAFAVLAPWIYSYTDEISGGQLAVHWLLGLATIGLALSSRRADKRPVTVIRAEPELSASMAEAERRRRAA
jgi:hypothetical protein